jgi:ferredoxin--NADP+ reductase
MDVARILARTPEELVQTDIADYALDALSQSKVKEITILGRRGPAQAAFTNPEIKEMGELADAEIHVLPAEAELDSLSMAALEQSNDRATMKKVEILQTYAARPPEGKSRRITVRFLVSPVELLGIDGQVDCVRLVKNELVAADDDRLNAQPTDVFEELPVGLVFRSVGYRGVLLPGVPFNDRWGVIPNERGRVINPDTEEPLVGKYTAGWIKRGPSGIIGTNKPDALETVNCMLADLKDGQVLTPNHPNVADAEALVTERQPNVFSFEDWLKLNEIEVSRGQEAGRPRVKFTRVEDMLAALGR